MQVTVKSGDKEFSQLRKLAAQRAQFVIRRLTWLVPRAKVYLSDVNGPRGGIDKRCQVELQTDSMGTIVVTSMARDWRSALDNALERAARVLTRSLHRNRDRGRLRRQTLSFDN